VRQGMRGNQEVGDHSLPLPAPPTIRSPGITGSQRRSGFHGSELGAQPRQCLPSLVGGGEEACRLGPYDLTGQHATLDQAGIERALRAWAEIGIGTEDVEQDVGVDGGDQIASTLPRRRRISWSVGRPGLRIP